MGYRDYLQDLLRPLGVYDLRPGSLSGGETEALGQELDAAAEKLDRVLRESLTLTASAEGLAAAEALFPFSAAGDATEDRRAAVSGFLQISGDSFTPAALNRCLAACGTACAVRETAERNVVEVSFPGVAGEPAGFAEKQRIIESILPCHLEVRYRLQWVTFGQTATRGLLWSDLAEETFLSWALG